MIRVIGLGEWVVSNHPGDLLKTYALATCIGVTVYADRQRAAGMIHIVLPEPPNKNEAEARPAYYAVTGIPLLFNRMFRMFGCLPCELHVGLAGGAEVMGDRDVFMVGPRNLVAIRMILDSMRLPYRLIDVGGYYSRTLIMNVHTGEVTVVRQSLLLKN
ncbi:MAG: chemotaxis protein CheD [Sporolactobacillus sp.]|nr:chemotaxis protein CheD [Sporolactobacillus sp.]